MNPLALLHLSPGVGEILLVLLVALLFFGADELPGIARSLGRFLHQIRHAADDFHDRFLDADLDPPGSSSSHSHTSANSHGAGAHTKPAAGELDPDSSHPGDVQDGVPVNPENGAS